VNLRICIIPTHTTQDNVLCDRPALYLYLFLSVSSPSFGAAIQSLSFVLILLYSTSLLVGLSLICVKLLKLNHNHALIVLFHYYHSSLQWNSYYLSTLQLNMFTFPHFVVSYYLSEMSGILHSRR
jgi:hypothetical protein